VVCKVQQPLVSVGLIAKTVVLWVVICSHKSVRFDVFSYRLESSV
jgi:hypothetical protein